MNDFIGLIANKDSHFSELDKILFQLSKKNLPNSALCFFIKTNKDMYSSIFHGVLVSVSNNETLVDRNFIADLLEYINSFLNYQIPSILMIGIRIAEKIILLRQDFSSLFKSIVDNFCIF
jgi:hypothetical protein